MQFQPMLKFLLVLLLMPSSIYSEGDAIVQINSSIIVHFIIIDPHGRKTGADPRGSADPEIGIEVGEIPGANYSTSGVGDSPENDDPKDSDLSHEFLYKLHSPENDGIYTIEVIGIDSGWYNLFINISPRSGSNIQKFRISVNSIVNKNNVITYRIEYHGDSSIPIKFEKMITPSTLRQDLDNSYKLKLLGEQGFYKELSNYLDNYEKHLAKKDSLKAAKEVEKFQSRIKKEDLEADSSDKRFVAPDGWEILNADAQYIIEHLVNLPAKSQGTLLQQIDELKTELIRQQNKKNIGGVLLVKSLTFLAEQAKKQLQKTLPSTSDSAAAALAIAAFQLLVDETWELTEELSGKGKKFAALFVYDEAYIQLHYRAKYILEALPAPRTLIDMKSVQMDDDVRKELDAMQKMSKEQ